jgi:hypothetical protein
MTTTTLGMDRRRVGRRWSADNVRQWLVQVESKEEDGEEAEKQEEVTAPRPSIHPNTSRQHEELDRGESRGVSRNRRSQHRRDPSP